MQTDKSHDHWAQSFSMSPTQLAGFCVSSLATPRNNRCCANTTSNDAILQCNFSKVILISDEISATISCKPRNYSEAKSIRIKEEPATMQANERDSFEDSLFYNDGPTTLLERLGYVRQLFFTKTKLEFRLLWNKIFHKQDEELGWLLNPYKQNGHTNATMMSSFNRNDPEASYQADFDTVSGVFGRERVTIHNRGLAKKSDRRRRRKRQDDESLGDKALKYARYMGMGVYITSTSFPSPFFPVNDCAIYEENLYYNNYQNSYTMSKVW